MKIRFVSLASVVALTVLAGLLLFGGFTGQAQLQETEAVVEPPVLDALEGASEVAVIVSLIRPDLALGIPDVSELRGITAERQARVLSALTASDFQVTWQFAWIPALAGNITASGVERLRSHGDVVRIYIPPVFSLDLLESVPLIRADEVHASGIDGTGVTVAVLDSGIDTDHPDLQDDIAGEECRLVDPESFPWPCPNGEVTQSGPGAAEDDLGHGTLVAGVITSDGNVAPVGVAPKAKVFAYKVCDAVGQCPFTNALAAFGDIGSNHPGEFAALNMSFGRGTYGPGNCDNVREDMFFALTVLRNQGTLPFASTGNQALKAEMKLPACISPVISVGQTYDENFGFLAWPQCNVSDFGFPDRVVCTSNSSDVLDLMAPGVTITTTSFDGQTEPVNGTSFASPHAVAVVALLRHALPGLTSEDVVKRLKATGALVTDTFNDPDPGTNRTTPRVDARVALLTNDADDFDQDGCTNGREFGTNPSFGGERNALHFWDFFDVWTGDPPVRDRRVDGFDIGGVVARFGTFGILPGLDLVAEALTPPTDTTGYHVAFDRGGPYVGVDLWHLKPPNGPINGFDIASVQAQFGHTCA